MASASCKGVVIPFSRVSLQDIIDRILSDFQTRITGAVSFLRRSVIRVFARVNGGVFHQMYEYLDFQARQLFITTADEAGLDAHSSEYGIPRKAAVAATGSGAATGTNGVVIPAATELSATSGQVYATDSEATIATGTATLAFTAELEGADGNDDAGITLTFVSPIAGVNTSVTVDSNGIANGTDEETDDALRDRVLTRKRQPPHGGAEFDYEVWTLEIAGNTRAWSFPLYQGVGTIGVAYVRDDDASIIPDATEIATTRAYIVEHEDPGTGETVGIPVTAEPGLFMITLSLLTVNFEIAISPNVPAVQATVTANLADLITREGGPGETIYLSQISEAISLSLGEGQHRLITPAADVTAATNQVHSLGTITFTNY